MNATILGPLDLDDDEEGGGLISLLSGLAGERASAILPDAALMRIREVAGAFHADFSVKVGDVLTPRADAPIKGAGEPHLVIEGRLERSRCLMKSTGL